MHVTRPSVPSPLTHHSPEPPQSAPLTAPRATALYVGALLGPSLLLLPGLAAQKAGAAALLAWATLLVLSALLAFVFSRLGTSVGSRAGVAGYAAAGLGPVLGRATGWAFLLGVITGVPVVCLIGGQYVAAVVAEPAYGPAFAGALLVVVLFLRLFGANSGARLQLLLMGLLLAFLVVAICASAGSARADNWRPFLSHGWSGVVGAAGHLMMAFVGWEAAAPLTARLSNARRQLPRVILAAFGITSVVYLALAAVLQAVLGAGAATVTPLAALLEVAVGPAGPWLAAVIALLLTLGVTNAYLASAAATAQHLMQGGRQTRQTRQSGMSRVLLTVSVAAFGALLLGLSAVGIVDLSLLVALPTAFFLLVYLVCCAAAGRLLARGARMAAIVATVTTGGLLVAAGTVSLLALVAVAVVTVVPGPRAGSRASSRSRAKRRA
ncbi:APC family permease [Streptomyces sp. NPDC088387]|uniref:APC family permease n=1 Tax=Streptomyces sp. NPDC088387 TaxID=3365859 RepID=UPI0037F8ECC8